MKRYSVSIRLLTCSQDAHKLMGQETARCMHILTTYSVRSTPYVSRNNVYRPGSHATGLILVRAINLCSWPVHSQIIPSQASQPEDREGLTCMTDPWQRWKSSQQANDDTPLQRTVMTSYSAVLCALPRDPVGSLTRPDWPRLIPVDKIALLYTVHVKTSQKWRSKVLEGLWNYLMELFWLNWSSSWTTGVSPHGAKGGAKKKKKKKKAEAMPLARDKLCSSRLPERERDCRRPLCLFSSVVRVR